MTHYVVLARSEEAGEEFANDQWIQFTAIEARSARSAITKAMEGPNNPYAGGGTFIAVPLRSWRPVTVKVETKTALKFS